jgi:LacI family transcriptional regulator
MARKKRRQDEGRPHVALLVETSLISGREILRGISRYVQSHGPGAIYHEPRSLGAAAPAWLKTWRGDGTPKRSRWIEPTGLAVRHSTDTVAVGDEDVVAALTLIHQRACDGLTVRDVVAHVSVSHSTLKERFRRILRRTIRDEMIRTQLKQAQQRLATTDWPLRTIAVKAGFRHQEYMGAVFRARLARTPGQFRKEAQMQG